MSRPKYFSYATIITVSQQMEKDVPVICFEHAICAVVLKDGSVSLTLLATLDGDKVRLTRDFRIEKSVLHGGSKASFSAAQSGGGMRGGACPDRELTSILSGRPRPAPGP
jgi:hypothetical protein